MWQQCTFCQVYLMPHTKCQAEAPMHAIAMEAGAVHEEAPQQRLFAYIQHASALRHHHLRL